MLIKGFNIVHGFGITALAPPIPPPPVLTITASSPLPVATVGSAYSDTITVIGGVPPYGWVITSDTPNTGSWLSINSTTGALTGTPGTAETESVTIKVTDSVGTTATKTFSLTVNSTPAPTITTASPLPAATISSAYSTTIAATSGVLPYTWSITSDTPDTGSWLSINSSSGVLSGTPGTAETETVTVKVTDHVGSTASKTFSLAVNSNAGVRVKWNPGHYGASNIVMQNSSVASSNYETAVSTQTFEITTVRGGPAQVLGYQPIFYFNLFENVTAGQYNFTDIDRCYTGITGYQSGQLGAAVYNAPRRLMIYVQISNYFAADPTSVVPQYIYTNSTYGPGPSGSPYFGWWTTGGATNGGCSAWWRSSIMARIQAMFTAMATHVLPDGYTVDTSPFVEAIFLAETAEIPVPQNDSTYTAVGLITLIEGLNSAMASNGAFAHTSWCCLNNYAGGPDESQTLELTLATSRTAASGPDTFGFSSGTSPATGSNASSGLAGLTWGQLAYCGFGSPGDGNGTGNWTPNVRSNLAGTVPFIANIQGTEFGYDVFYDPNDIFQQLNQTLKATHAIWSILGPGSVSESNGNWWGTATSQSTWNSSIPSVLSTIVNNTLSTTAYPTSYPT